MAVHGSACHPVRDMRCRVVSCVQATHDIRILGLEIEAGGPLVFSAGQYVELLFRDLPGRDYSMASRPDEESLEFHVRQEVGGEVSRFVVESLTTGEVVRARGPFGDAYLRQRLTGPILAVAGGTGLAPIKSIVGTALAMGMTQYIHLYYGAREARDIYLEDHFNTLAADHPNFRFTVAVSAPRNTTVHRTGLVGDVVIEDLGDLRGWTAYIAGPPVMVESVQNTVIAHGLDPGHCFADPFITMAEKAALAAEN